MEKGNEEYSIYLILIFYLVMIQIFIALKWSTYFEVNCQNSFDYNA